MDSITTSFILLAALFIALDIFALWWLVMLLIPYFNFGGPYVPSSETRVKEMIRIANLQTTDRIVDLGSGDGRIVIEAAKAGAREAVGYEIHSGLVKQSRLSAQLKGVGARTKFIKRSFWKEDLGEFDVVFMFQIPFAMSRMSKKLKNELPKGARIVSNGYKIPGFTPVSSGHQLYLYMNE